MNSEGSDDWTVAYTVSAPIETDIVEFGVDGDWAPITEEGVAYESYIALLGRLFTYRGRQIMRPGFGSEAYKFVYRINRLALLRAIGISLSGVSGLQRIEIFYEDGVVVAVITLDNRVLTISGVV